MEHEWPFMATVISLGSIDVCHVPDLVESFMRNGGDN